MTAPGQGTRWALHPHRGQGIEPQAALLKGPLRHSTLDPVLALEKPVQGAGAGGLARVRLQELAPGADRGRLGPPPGRGQLRGGLEEPRHDHGQDRIAPGRGLRGDPPVQAPLLPGSQHRGDRAGGKGTAEVEGGAWMAHCGSSREEGAQSRDESGRPPGAGGEGALLDLAGFTRGFAQPEGGRRGAVGDGFAVPGS